MKFGTGGEGKVGENDEELESHLLVALAQWEMVGRGLVDGEQRQSAKGIGGEDAPAVEGGRGVAGELRESKVELKVRSAWVERP